MDTTLILQHERVDAIPLLIGKLREWHLPSLIDACLGAPRHAMDLPYGLTLVVWLVYLLTAQDHRKSPVAAWVAAHQQTLTRALGTPVAPEDFTEVRLTQALHRLSRDGPWYALEAALFGVTVQATVVETEGVRLDGSTVAGYHVPVDGGLMQFGHSKDHRPDLAQVKLMLAASGQSGQLLAMDLWPGQTADDPCYTPLIARVRAQVGRTGLLYQGDCKMSALATRAELVAHGDHYLMPLAQPHATAAQWEAWITEGIQRESTLTPIVQEEEVLGVGYEVTRRQTATVDAQELIWDERVLVIRSTALRRQETDALLARVATAEQALRALTPPLGPGRRQIREESRLQAAIVAILQRARVEGLLTVTWDREEYQQQGRDRVRYQVTAVRRCEQALTGQIARLGWRVLVTTPPAAQLPLAAAVCQYRAAWSLESLFHLGKALPLGIAPLGVRREDQLRGLTRLVALAIRVMRAVETEVRVGLAQLQTPVAGLYPERPLRTTLQPTLTRLLEACTRAEITLTQIEMGQEHRSWFLTPLPPWLLLILEALQLTPSWYQRLIEDSG